MIVQEQKLEKEDCCYYDSTPNPFNVTCSHTLTEDRCVGKCKYFKTNNMALIIEAPNEVYSLENKNNVKLFLAGGITNCSDWQSYVTKELSDIEHLTIYNPRRKNFPINDPKAAEEQITWEFSHLRDSTILFFWFAKGSLNPIVLYELGMWCNCTDRPAVIGIDPLYERKQDVIIQTQLARPKQIIHSSIQDMIDEVCYMFKEFVNNEDEDND